MTMYENGTGRHQRTFDRLRELIPHYGYTGKRWLDAFICLHRMYYYVTLGNFEAGFSNRFRDEVYRYILPLFPNFDLSVYDAGDRHMIERQMDVVLNIMGSVSESEFKAKLHTAWYNRDLKLISPRQEDGPGWKPVTLGSEKDLRWWCDAYFADGWKMGYSDAGSGVTGQSFRLGGLQAEFRDTDKGLTLFLSDGKVEVPALRLTTREKRLGDSKWTDVQVVIPYSIQENGRCETRSLLTPDDLPTVYMRPDGKLYCQKCHCTVPNTASVEIRKEGYYAHSHVCGFRGEGEVYDDD